VVLGLDHKRGQFAARARAQALAVGQAIGSVGGGGEKAHLGEGCVQGRVRRSEEQLVCLAGLEQRQKLVVAVGVEVA